LWQRGRRVGDAVFQGRLYRVADYPGAVASDDPADCVKGLLLALDNPAQVFSELDLYEGVPDLFRRQPVMVKTGKGETLSAWIYLYNRPVRRLARIRSGDFLNDRGFR